jgi:hypothetical protein
MKLWLRLLFALLAMALASIIVAFLWRRGFNTQIPSYFAGVIGGLAALGTWELLRRK